MISYLKMMTGKLERHLLNNFFQRYQRAVSPVIKIGGVTVLPLFLLIGCYAGNVTGLAAATAPNSIAAPTVKLLFKSNFGPGVSLGAPYNFSTKGAYKT